MCARYTREIEVGGVDDVFDLADEWDEDDRDEAPGTETAAKTWNAAPGTDQLIIRRSRNGARVRRAVRWGIRPEWDPKKSIINARAESVRSKPVFRESFLRRRCLVPASGFYEWTSLSGKRVPHYFVVGDGGLFAMGGFFTASSEEPSRFCLLTTEPNATVAAMHDRMAVIIEPANYDRWMDPSTEPDVLRELMVPFGGKMRSWRVSTDVNRVSATGPTLVDRFDEPQLSLF
ncbi:MAG: putative SOS response-associated peptidase YedK [Bradymonadia bacterium]|jgi:putative SOS response-associated peptidase YedK